MFLARTFSKIKHSRLKQLAPIQKVISNFCTTTLPPTDKDSAEAKHTEDDFDHITDESSLIEVLEGWKESDADLLSEVRSTMRVLPGFVTPSEEASMLAELEPKLRRMRYEFDHWDDAIHGYRETEVGTWGPVGSAVIARVTALAFPLGGLGGQARGEAPPQQIKQVQSLARETAPAAPTGGTRALGPGGQVRGGRPLGAQHVLDLAPTGHIKPHIDAVRFCGPVIAGLCLVSSAVMVLQHEAWPRLRLRALLPRRSLYIMSGVSRYSFTHAIPSGAESEWRGARVPRKRRVAVITRSEPQPGREGGEGGYTTGRHLKTREDDVKIKGDDVKIKGHDVKLTGDDVKSQEEGKNDPVLQTKPDYVQILKKTEKSNKPSPDEATV